MITRVVHPFNLQRALEHVIANKGSAGVDGVSIRELRKVFSEKKLQLIEAIKQGNYQVQPILGIPQIRNRPHKMTQRSKR